MSQNGKRGPPLVVVVMEGWGRGGTEAYVRELVRWARSRKVARFCVMALCGDAQTLERMQQALGEHVEGVEILHADGGMGALLALRRRLRQLKPAVCHFHLYTSLLPAVLAVRLSAKAQRVTTLHQPVNQWRYLHRIGWRAAIRMSDEVTGVSKAVLASGGAQVENEGRLTRPPLAHEIAIATLGIVRQPDDRTFVVAGVGRLSREKRWDTLIRAIADLEGREPGRWKLKLFGEGPKRKPLESLARELGIGQLVCFRGYLQKADLLAELRNCSASVLSSDFEGFGMAAIEAMALGVPVVTADFPASRDFLKPGVTGLTFASGNHMELADRIESLASDTEAAARMASEGKRFVLGRFSPDAVFGVVGEIYAEQC